MAELELSNVINISVSEQGAGLSEYNTSNLALFTDEQPGGDFVPADGYAIYFSPTQVGVDFGTSSETYAMANRIFSQQPNILANNGYLVVIPLIPEVQTVTPSAPPASGTYILNFGGDATAAINWNDTAAQIQVKVRTITGLELATVAGTLATHLTVTFYGYYGDAALMTVTSNTLNGSITLTVAQVTAGEALGAAITRTQDLVQYFGILGNQIFPQVDMLAAAAVVQALNKMAFFVSITAADVEPDGMLDLLQQNGYTHSRGLFYGGATAALGMNMMAAYAGRALSTNFDGSNTTQTMHLKDLTGVTADPSMTQTLLNKCLTAGVDTYVSLQGVAKVFCSGANSFFDQVYNLGWFVGALQIAGFNYLAQSSTKIPQTEGGMTGLKGAYRKVCEQGVTNQYSAPGSWNSSTTFGNQEDFLANIRQRGYYIYSSPVADQSAADREDRIAPLVQIALKEAGAIHSSTVIVNINA